MTNAKHATDRGKLFILAAICLSALVLPLSFTGGAVATPAIGRDLGGSPVALIWITVLSAMVVLGLLSLTATEIAEETGMAAERG